MLKYFISAVLASIVASQECAVCWDGSEATFEQGQCVCPPAVAPQEKPSSSESTAANPNCTSGNINACNKAFGFFDYTSCECTFPPERSASDDFDEEDADEFNEMENDDDWSDEDDDESDDDWEEDLSEKDWYLVENSQKLARSWRTLGYYSLSMPVLIGGSVALMRRMGGNMGGGGGGRNLRQMGGRGGGPGGPLDFEKLVMSVGGFWGFLATFWILGNWLDFFKRMVAAELRWYSVTRWMWVLIFFGIGGKEVYQDGMSGLREQWQEIVAFLFFFITTESYVRRNGDDVQDYVAYQVSGLKWINEEWDSEESEDETDDDMESDQEESAEESEGEESADEDQDE